ncbi:thiamine phosphate synthase [Geobacillus sp. YF-1]|uniref:thiamine phosphate synthase n=1 Tax=Geobacillus sp. YF-1 TaxID=3457480 RepID=UPI0040467D81
MARIAREEMKKRLAVYFIMGSQNSERPAVDVLKEALDGGVTLFQFREKGAGALQGAEKEALARQLQRLCRAHGVPLIVNDDVELAIAIDADGVHVGQDDEDARRVREKIGDKILGVSAHNVEEARAAIEAGADYIGVGPIYPTRSKEDANEAQGLEILRSLREQGIAIPIVAIGGITVDNAQAVIEAGADGVSVISAIASASEPKAAAAALAAAVQAARSR